MPTGYTDAVLTGKITGLREFALTCARAMGALIMMRDDPMDAPIPKQFAPNTEYYDERLADARADLAEIMGFSPAECTAKIVEDISAAEEYRDKYLVEKDQDRSRYVAMLEKVEAWETAADGLKDFMLSQLRDSLKWDCDGDYIPSVPDMMSVDDWRAEKTTKIFKDIAYLQQKIGEEIQRTEERNQWLTALLESLPDE